MKKFLFTSLFLLLTCVSFAQSNTYVVKVGSGLETAADGGFYLRPGFEANIPLAHGSTFLFSPSVNINIPLSGDMTIEAPETFVSTIITIPLSFGKKINIGNACFLVPKIGPMLGYATGKKFDDYVHGYNLSYDQEFKGGFFVGGSLEISLEYKHFAFGVHTSIGTSIKGGYMEEYCSPYDNKVSVRDYSDYWDTNPLQFGATIGYKF